MNALPLVGSIGSIALVAGVGGATSGSDRLRSYLAAGMFLLATLGFVVVQVDRQRSQRRHRAGAARAGYLRYLAVVRRDVRAGAVRQREQLARSHPDPRALPAQVAEGSRVWVTSESPHVLPARYGLGSVALDLELVAPDESPTEEADPVASSALRRLLAAHTTQADLPATLDLARVRELELCGDAVRTRALARALICSAVVATGPSRLRVEVDPGLERSLVWDWIKWLPHTVNGGADRADRAEGGHVLVVAEGERAAARPDATTLRLRAPCPGDVGSRGHLRLHIGDDLDALGRPSVRLGGDEAGNGSGSGRADQCDLTTAEAVARRLARHHDRGGPTAGDGGPDDVLALLGLGSTSPAFDAAWAARSDRDRLRVPIGTDDDGAAVFLDLKEAAQQGMGPHGLLVGATGSGKSEFLRTLVLGLVATHSPERLNLVLVDFKGGATFAPMARLPHVSAVITNLADELTLVDRMHDALSGEMVRRQELLRDAGDLASVRDYEAARAAHGLPALPSLLIVVDEFSELLTARPDLVELFVAIGRLGRSLGLHLLLSSQRLEEGRLRGLESHLSYRIGLRTFSAQESRAALGVADAYELPSRPGLGYLRSDPTTLTRFSAAHVSRPPPRRRRPTSATIRSFTLAGHAQLEPPSVPATVSMPELPLVDPEAAGASVLESTVAALHGLGPAAHQVWLPPLDAPATLDELLGDLRVDARLGLVSPRWRARGPLVVPVGVVDLPRRQSRETLRVDLAGAAGHVGVVGGPRSGRSTLVRDLVASLCLTTTPREAQFLVLDLGGTSLSPLSRLPHVAGLATRSEPDVVRRIVAEAESVLDRREEYFRTHAVDTIETYRERDDLDDGWGDVFLVVDGWSTLRTDLEDLEQRVQRLASRGLAYGVHVVASASRWSDYRATMRDLLGTRVELHLGDALDSEIDRKAASAVPAGRPGRGLVTGASGPEHVLVALPRIDGDPAPATLRAGIDGLVEQIASAWPGPAGPRLRLLPPRIDLDDVRALVAEGDGTARRRPRLLLGVDEADLAAVGLDPSHQPHLLVLGDSGAGKTSVLRTLLREVVETHTPSEAQVLLVDYRRALLGEVPEPYRLDHVTTPGQAAATIGDLADFLASRRPGPDVTPAQLRSRTWWNGAEVYVVVDDYDLVSPTAPLAPLVPLLAQARDVGLHLVVARRSGGASRAMYDPALQALRDLAMPGLLLSGSPEEGPLVGSVRAAALPPGRGRLVTRERGLEVVQTAWVEPAC